MYESSGAFARMTDPIPQQPSPPSPSSPLSPSSSPAIPPTSPGAPRSPGLFGREEAIVDHLRAFLASYADRTARAEEARREQTEAAAKKHRLATARAEEELKRRLLKADTQLAEAIEQLDAQFTERRAHLLKDLETRLAAQQERYERRGERIEREYRESVWLAETVLESSKPKPGQEFDALCKRLDAGCKSLAEYEVFVASLWPKVVPHKEPLESAEAESADTLAHLSIPDDPETFETLCEDVQQRAHALDRLRLPGFFRSGLAMFVAPVVVAVAVLGVGFATEWTQWKPAVAAGGAAFILAVGLLIPLRRAAARRFRKARREFDSQLAHARAVAE
ncbi:hypothetical protein MNBD_PLANCTO03-523, partial [hydrothermal vent metagenome]